MSENATISSLLNSLSKEAANAKKWQSKAALQAEEIKRLNERVSRLRNDKLQLLADLKEQRKTERLVFNNADAKPKSSVLDIHMDGVPLVCQWYAGFFAGDLYTVTLNGRNIPLDHNGEPQLLADLKKQETKNG